MFLKLVVVVGSLTYLSAANINPTPPDLDGRIVGGVATTIQDYPYQLSLEVFNQHSCGASLISPEWVITAAHCTKNIPPYAIRIRAGSSKSNTGGRVFSVERVYINNNYNSQTIDYDVSLLKLKNPITDKYAIPIDLPDEGTIIPAGLDATVTGWGTNKENGQLSRYLMAVEVPILPHYVCQQAYGANKITERMMCAGFSTGGKDACQGDSGGPLAIDNTLVGIVSWGYGCARPEYPGVYTNVASVRSYIRSITGI